MSMKRVKPNRTPAHADLAHVQDVVAEHGQTFSVLIASVP